MFLQEDFSRSPGFEEFVSRLLQLVSIHSRKKVPNRRSYFKQTSQARTRSQFCAAGDHPSARSDSSLKGEKL